MKGTMVIVRWNYEMESHDVTVENVAQEVRKAVGGDVELIPRFESYRDEHGQIRRCVAFCNEHGKLEQQPVNVYATHMWYTALNGLMINDYLAGDIAVVYGDDEFMRKM